MKIEKFYLDDGTFIRFKKIGNGAPILLLHTFRNRLEYSDKLGKLLEDKFTVYSIDLPGFGDSPINTSTNYNLDFFTKSIKSFIKKLRIKNLTIAGESIGATLAASVSVELPKIVKKIFMFNPYDYDSYFGEAIRRGNFFAKFILFNISLPIIFNFISNYKYSNLDVSLFLHISTTLLAKSFVPFPPSDQCVQRLTLTLSLAHCSWIILTSLSVSVIK